MSVLRVEPGAGFTFLDVRPNKAQRQTVIITNPLQSAVHITLRVSSPTRYQLEGGADGTTARHLNPGQSLELNLVLRLPTLPKLKPDSSYKDTLYLKSEFFEQRVPIHLHIAGSSTSVSTSGPGNATHRAKPLPRYPTSSTTTASEQPEMLPQQDIAQPPLGADEKDTHASAAGNNVQPSTGGQLSSSAPAEAKDESSHRPAAEKKGGVLCEDELQRAVEQAKQEVTHSLSSEFNAKCEKFIQMFKDKDALLREREDALARVGRDLVQAREREAEAEDRAGEERKRADDLHVAVRAKAEEIEECRREISRKEAMSRGQEKEMKQRIRDLELENGELHRSVLGSQVELEELRQQRMQDSATVASVQQKEDQLLLAMLKDKIEDQKEQIDVLIQELEVERSQAVASAAAARSSTSSAHQSSPSNSSSEGSHLGVDPKEKGQGRSRSVSRAADARRLSGGAAAAAEDGVNNAEAAVAIRTEVRTLQKALEKCEQERDQLRTALEKAQAGEAELQEKVWRLEGLQAKAREAISLNEAKLSEASARLQHERTPSDARTTSNAQSVGGCSCVDDMASGCPTAQAWWLSLVQGLRAERRGDDETWDDESLEEQLKDSVVEIARLKQELLARSIEIRQIRAHADEAARASARRITHLEWAVRAREEEYQVKIRETERSVRVLSGRSDMHRALACARQELTTERVTTAYLQGEIDVQKRLLLKEEERGNKLRNRLEVVQAALDNATVADSLRQSGPVSPLALIEHFAGVMLAATNALQELRRRLGPDAAVVMSGRSMKARFAGEGDQVLNRQQGYQVSPQQQQQKQQKHPPQAPPQQQQQPLSHQEEQPPLPPPPYPHRQTLPTSALLKRFSDSVEGSQQMERLRRAEAECDQLKEENLRYRMEADKALERARREKDAVEEANALTAAGWERQMTVLRGTAVKAREEAVRLKGRIALLEDEVLTEKAKGIAAHAGVVEQSVPVQSASTQRAALTAAASSPDRSKRHVENQKLREAIAHRDMQISVLAESLEALQAAVTAGREPPAEQYALPKLAKRVVALTVDLTHALSVAGIMERRAEELGEQVAAREEQRLKVLEALRQAQDAAESAAADARRVVEDVKSVSKSRGKRFQELEVEVGELTQGLAEAEGALGFSRQARAEAEARVRQLEEVLASAASSTLPALHDVDAGSADMRACVAKAFCEGCGRLRRVFGWSVHRVTREGRSSWEGEHHKVPDAQPKVSYIELLKEAMERLQKWHEETLAALRGSQDAATAPGQGALDADVGCHHSAQSVESLMDAVAQIFASADQEYVKALAIEKKLRWELDVARAEVVTEARARERLLREQQGLRKAYDTLRKLHLAMTAQEADKGVSQFESRCKELSETVTAFGLRLSRADDDKAKLHAQLKEARAMRPAAERRAEAAIVVADASVMTAQADAAHAVHEKISSVESIVLRWCETEVPLLLRSMGNSQGQRQEVGAIVEALCATKAAHSSAVTRLEAALREADSLRASSADLRTALTAVISRPAAGVPGSAGFADDPEGSEVDSRAPDSRAASGCVRHVTAHVAEVEQQMWEANRAREHAEQAAMKLRQENEGLKAAMQTAADAHRSDLEASEASVAWLQSEVDALRRLLQDAESRVDAADAGRSRAAIATNARDAQTMLACANGHTASALRGARVAASYDRLPSYFAAASAPRGTVDEDTLARTAQLERRCQLLEEEVLTKQRELVRLRDALKIGAGAFAAQDMDTYESLEDRVKRQASVIAYLEIRLAEATGGSGGVQEDTAVISHSRGKHGLVDSQWTMEDSLPARRRTKQCFGDESTGKDDDDDSWAEAAAESCHRHGARRGVTRADSAAAEFKSSRTDSRPEAPSIAHRRGRVESDASVNEEDAGLARRLAGAHAAESSQRADNSRVEELERALADTQLQMGEAQAALKDLHETVALQADTIAALSQPTTAPSPSDPPKASPLPPAASPTPHLSTPGPATKESEVQTVQTEPGVSQMMVAATQTADVDSGAEQEKEVDPSETTRAAEAEIERLREREKSMTAALAMLREDVAGVCVQAEEKLRSKESEWRNEKASLELEVDGLQHELRIAQTAHASAVEGMRVTFDKTVRDVEATRRAQLTERDEKIGHLQALLAQTRESLDATQREMMARESQEEAKLMAHHGADVPASVASETQAEIDRLTAELEAARRAYQDAEDALQESRRQLQVAERARDDATASVKELAEAFRTFRKKQADLVSDLETRLRDRPAPRTRRLSASDLSDQGVRRRTMRRAATAPTDGSPDGEDDATTTRLPEHEDLLVQLEDRERIVVEMEMRVKQREMDARRACEERDRAISAAIGGVAQRSEGVGEGSASTREADVALAVLEGRLALAEQEVAKLMKDLEAEKQSKAELRDQLTSRILQAAELRRQHASSSAKALLKELADAKRSAKLETDRLRSIIRQLQSQVPLAKEFEESKAALQKAQTALASAKDEVARKSRLLATYKASRQADERTIVQWRTEITSLEDRARQLKRDLQRKDKIISELRAKLQARGGEAMHMEDAVSEGPLSSRTDAERTARVADERTRLKQRVGLLEDRRQSLQAELAEVKQRLQGHEEAESRLAALRTSTTRKDSLLRAAKAKILTFADELNTLRIQVMHWQGEAEKYKQKTAVLRRSVSAPIEPAVPTSIRQSRRRRSMDVSYDQMRQQLHALAELDSGAVQSLLLSTLASLHARGAPPEAPMFDTPSAPSSPPEADVSIDAIGDGAAAHEVLHGSRDGRGEEGGGAADDDSEAGNDGDDQRGGVKQATDVLQVEQVADGASGAESSERVKPMEAGRDDTPVEEVDISPSVQDVDMELEVESGGGGGSGGAAEERPRDEGVTMPDDLMHLIREINDLLP